MIEPNIAPPEDTDQSPASPAEQAPRPEAPAGDAASAARPATPSRRPLFARLEIYVPAVYALLGSVWIAWSDLLVAAVARTTRQHATWSILKGFGYVAVTTALLYAGLRWALAKERRAHAQVAASEALLKAMSEAIPDPVFLKDRQSRWLFANPAVLSAIGRSAADVLGRSDREIYADPAVGAALEANDRRIMQTGRPEVMEERVPTPAGVRVFLTSKAPYRDAEGRVVGIIGNARDITDRHLVETALRQRAALQERLAASEQRYRLLADHADDVIWTLDLGTRRFSYVSPSIQKLRGLTVEEALAEPVEESLTPESLQRVQAVMARIGTPEEENSHTGIYDQPCRDGTVKHVEITTSYVRDPSGRPVQVVGVSRDATARVKAERALRDALAQLTEADRRKSEFLAVLSHELRNPLAPIRNAVYLLERVAPDSPTAARSRAVLERQTAHLTRLVDDLLDVTRISRGKIALQPLRLDARELLRRTCEDHRSLFEARGVALRVEADEPVWIEADATRLAQVLGNLLQNAAKFSREGGTVVATVAAVGGKAEIRVRDDGVGIAPELLPRLFEPFVQADGGLARTKGGLGLGLALVKGLVELHGGTVRVHSDGPERGAELVVSLPLMGPAAPSPSSQPAVAGRRPREVLVVEDNVDAARSIADVLEMDGHRVRVATDGRSGLARAREQVPEVVLCDIGLPDLDGCELARAIRADAAFRDTRLIALSAYAQAEDRKRALEAGFEAFLAKPPAIEELLALLAGAGS